MDTTMAPHVSLGRQGWNFARHYLEMCIAMCVGGALLAVVVFAVIPSLIGNPDLREQFPELSLLVIALILTVPMAAWMRFRGMERRPIFEMAAVPFVLALLLIALAWVALLASSTLQISFGSFCSLSCVGMFLVMLFRLDMYTGRAGHHAGHVMPAG